MERSKNPTCSPLLVRPFARMLRSEGATSTEVLARLEAIEATPDRVSIAVLQKSLGDIAAALNDPMVGLRAALYTEIGDFEVLEWVAMSAATWRDANEIACRYARVLNDASDYRFQVIGDKSHLVLGSTIPLHPVAADYQVAAYHLAIQMRVNDVPGELEVCFRRPEPEDFSSRVRIRVMRIHGGEHANEPSRLSRPVARVARARACATEFRRRGRDPRAR